jgi:hypothetical protein
VEASVKTDIPLVHGQLLTLESLLGDRRKLLTDWGSCGQITAAAKEALQPNRQPELLKRLLAHWSGLLSTAATNRPALIGPNI